MLRWVILIAASAKDPAQPTSPEEKNYASQYSSGFDNEKKMANVPQRYTYEKKFAPDVSQYTMTGAADAKGEEKGKAGADYEGYIPKSWQGDASMGDKGKDATAPKDLSLAEKDAKDAKDAGAGGDYDSYIPASWKKYVPSMGGAKDAKDAKPKDEDEAKGKHGEAVALLAQAAKPTTERDLDKEERAAEDASREAARKADEQLRGEEADVSKRAKEEEAALKQRAQKAEAAVEAKAKASAAAGASAEAVAEELREGKEHVTERLSDQLEHAREHGEGEVEHLREKEEHVNEKQRDHEEDLRDKFRDEEERLREEAKAAREKAEEAAEHKREKAKDALEHNATPGLALVDQQAGMIKKYVPKQYQAAALKKLKEMEAHKNMTGNKTADGEVAQAAALMATAAAAEEQNQDKQLTWAFRGAAACLVLVSLVLVTPRSRRVAQPPLLG